MGWSHLDGSSVLGCAHTCSELPEALRSGMASDDTSGLCSRDLSSARGPVELVHTAAAGFRESMEVSRPLATWTQNQLP